MKKLITIACCFAFVAAALAGCRRSTDNKRNDMTAPLITSTSSTSPTTSSTTPSTIPDSGFMPENDLDSNAGNENDHNANTNEGTGNMNGTVDNTTPRSRTHTPSESGRNR